MTIIYYLLLFYKLLKIFFVVSIQVMMLSWDDTLEVELIDTNGATDVIIADDLVSRGYAQYKTSKSAKRGTILFMHMQCKPLGQNTSLLCA